MKKAVDFIKKDPVLMAAWVLAIVSFFFVPPDRQTLSSIDWRSLGILWSLMAIVAGLSVEGVFEGIGHAVLSKAKTCGSLAFLLVFLCFFAAMLITNDVVLITFVPFALMILREAGQEKQILPVVVCQTIAANLGSMLTPIGNPQNLYLYGRMQVPVTQFVGIVWPYAAASAVLLILVLMLLPGRKEALSRREEDAPRPVVPGGSGKRRVIVYLGLFVVALLAVLRVLPWPAAPAAVLLVMLAADRKVLLRVDYGLLLTFVGFFLFTGNMGRMEAVRVALERLVSGRELAAAVLASQAISNVPAALLLSGFTDNLPALLVGVNLGGLGTLIASMASLISWKAFTAVYPEQKGKYLLWFTAANLGFLAVLLGLAAVI